MILRLPISVPSHQNIFIFSKSIFNLKYFQRLKTYNSFVLTFIDDGKQLLGQKTSNKEILAVIVHCQTLASWIHPWVPGSGYTSLYNWCSVFSLMWGLLLDLAVLIFYFHKNLVICSLCLIYLKICPENDKFWKYYL